MPPRDTAHEMTLIACAASPPESPPTHAWRRVTSRTATRPSTSATPAGRRRVRRPTWRRRQTCRPSSTRPACWRSSTPHVTAVPGSALTPDLHRLDTEPPGPLGGPAVESQVLHALAGHVALRLLLERGAAVVRAEV